MSTKRDAMFTSGLWEAPASSSDFSAYLFIELQVRGISDKDVEAIADGKAPTAWSAPMFLSFLQVNNLAIVRCESDSSKFVWASRATGKPIFAYHNVSK